MSSGNMSKNNYERDEYDADYRDSTVRVVYTQEEPEWSGLYDKDGNQLIRKKSPVGFIDFERKKKNV